MLPASGLPPERPEPPLPPDSPSPATGWPSSFDPPPSLVAPGWSGVPPSLAPPLDVLPPAPEPEPPPEPAPEPKAKVKAAHTPEEVKAKAARKQHKLSVDVPQKFTARVTSSDWRRFPGMPDVLINRHGTAMQHHTSRRRGEYYKILALKFRNGRALWVHWKDGVRTYIPVFRAMYDTGHWKRSSRDGAG